MAKIKLYTIILFVLSVIFLALLGWLLQYRRPDQLPALLIFYLFSAALIFCVGTLAGLYIRKAFGQRELQNYYIKIAARQGLWLAAIFMVSLLLASFDLFSWLNATLLVLTLIFFESYLLISKKDIINHK